MLIKQTSLEKMFSYFSVIDASYIPDLRAIGNFSSSDLDPNTSPHTNHSQNALNKLEENSFEQSIYPTTSTTQYSHTTDVQQIVTQRKKMQRSHKSVSGIQNTCKLSNANA